MNTEPQSFDDAALEREWLTQEQAMHDERAQVHAANGDRRMQDYRLLARALREPLADSLPEDFAERMAQRCETQVGRQSVESFTTTFERRFLRWLVAAFGAMAGTVFALFAPASAQSIVEALSRMQGWVANPWLVAFGACLAISAALQYGPNRSARPRQR